MRTANNIEKLFQNRNKEISDFVILAHAGIQKDSAKLGNIMFLAKNWIPAFAGMTRVAPELQTNRPILRPVAIYKRALGTVALKERVGAGLCRVAQW